MNSIDFRNNSARGVARPLDCDEPAFCLGVEWESFRRQLLAMEAEQAGCSPNEFDSLTFNVNTANAERIVAMCERHNRFVETVALPGMPEWTQIIVGGLKTPEKSVG